MAVGLEGRRCRLLKNRGMVRLKPERFYDLMVQVAIVWPGPIQGGMVHPYLRRRAGGEAIDYPSEDIKTATERTLGIPLFQRDSLLLNGDTRISGPAVFKQECHRLRLPVSEHFPPCAADEREDQ